MSKQIGLMAGILILGTLSSAAMAAQGGVKVGVLTCHVDGGWGYVVGSSKDMTCNYHPNHGEDDRYVGNMSKFGVDIGYTSSGTLVWDVIAPTSDVRQGALQGDYGGATASATVAAGLGAHVLFGGFDKSIALQPVSFESNSGLNVAAGIGAMDLRRSESAPQHAGGPAPGERRAEIAPAPPVAAEEPRHATFALSFAFDQTRLNKVSRQTIRHAAQDARHMQPVHLTVTGHADHVGTAAYNDRLSLRRAEVVKRELIRDGVDSDRVRIAGRGFRDPLIDTPAGVRERRNRQVVVDISGSADARQASR